MTRILLEHVNIDIPIYNSHARSLKKAMMNVATGGRIGRGENGKTIVRALSDISFSIQQRERIGLLGHNGSGKSTLLRVLSGVYAPTSGKVVIEGDVGSLIDISLGIDGEATGIENIFLRAALLGINKRYVEKQLENIIEFSELGNFINMPVRTYSTGMHMRLAFAVSTMINPEILLMDEWLSVGDQNFQKKAEMKLNGLIERSNILVIASHSRDLIERCCTRVLWLEHGVLKMDGSSSEVCKEYFGN